MKIINALTLVISLVLTGCQSLSTHDGVYPSEASIASIQPGASKADVRRILGKPDSVSVYHRQREELWAYADLLLGGDEVWVLFSLDGLVTSVQKIPLVVNLGIAD